MVGSFFGWATKFQYSFLRSKATLDIQRKMSVCLIEHLSKLSISRFCTESLRFHLNTHFSLAECFKMFFEKNNKALLLLNLTKFFKV